VIDVGLTYNTKFILADPAPKSNGFSDFALLELCLSIKIEDLNDGLCTLGSSQSDNVLASVHQDAFSFHWLSLELEIVGCIDDCAIVGILDTNVLLRLEGD